MSKNNPPSAKEIKTGRILDICHLFLTCEEVSEEELRNNVRWTKDKETAENIFWTKKTISRDIATLKFAGLPIVYSGKRRAYILSERFGRSTPSEAEYSKSIAHLGKKEQQYIRKIKRLATFMNCLLHHVGEDDPCDIEYKRLFPAISKRTMQRDFNTLSGIGYELEYKRAWRETPKDRTWVDDITGESFTYFESPIGHYYIELLPFAY